MKKVLITGASGFVGKHLSTYLTEHTDSQIHGASHKELDLLDADAVSSYIQKTKPDHIYHLAALTSPADSFKNPAETITNNIVAELNLLEALKQERLFDTRMLVVSTSEVYGIVDPEDLPVNEQTPHRPISPYAVSKIAQDYLGLQYYLSHKLDVIRVRPFNHIGPGQLDKFVLPSFAKQIAEIEKDKKAPILSVGNLAAKRDFTDVRDVVRAYGLLMEKGISGEVYNVGSGKSHKIDELLELLLGFSSKTITVEVDPSRFRPVDIEDVVCDYSKLHKLTGWQPEIPLEKTLQDILAYWRDLI